MNSSASPQDFFSKVAAELRAIPLSGKLLAVGVALVSALLEVLFWIHRRNVTVLDYVALAGVILVWFVAMFAIVMMAIDQRASIASFVKFAATSLALLVPLALLGACLFLAVRFEVPALGFLCFLGLLPVALYVALLPGWPALQVTSAQIIGPIEALKSTKGIRLSLVLFSFVLGAINRGVPGTNDPRTLVQAVSFALLNGAITWLSLMFAASLAVVAWRHMSARLAMTS